MSDLVNVKNLKRSVKSTPQQAPQRPTNALHAAANAINSVVGLPGQAVDLLNEGFATATNFISEALPSFPAATLGSIAMGLPHAHSLHPPSLCPPAPPIPFIPIGPILFGTCVQVLINGLPAARCGDLGITPTCFGLPPIYEVFTGSSKVFIGGSRAARMIDITYHCKPIPPAGEAEVSSSQSLGIIGIRERVRQLNGEFIIAKRANGGTIVSVTVPLQTKQLQ